MSNLVQDYVNKHFSHTVALSDQALAMLETTAEVQANLVKSLRKDEELLPLNLMLFHMISKGVPINAPLVKDQVKEIFNKHGFELDNVYYNYVDPDEEKKMVEQAISFATLEKASAVNHDVVALIPLSLDDDENPIWSVITKRLEDAGKENGYLPPFLVKGWKVIK